MWSLRITTVLALALVLAAPGLGPRVAAAKDVAAGPIWNNMDAERKCPAVCSGAGLKWGGEWTTTVMGRESVCKCTGGGAGGGAGAGTRGRFSPYPAPFIFDNRSAQSICPGVCGGQRLAWDGNWRRTGGSRAECDCGR